MEQRSKKGATMRATKAKRRGRPSRLGREEIVAAALDIGLDRLTIRAVARRLGVGASSIYYHVEGIEQLLELAGDELLRSLSPEWDRDEWQAETRRAAFWLRNVFERSPGLAEQALRNPGWSRLVCRLNERACHALVDTGLDESDAWLAVRAVADFVEAFVAREQGFEARGYTDLEHVLRSASGECPTLCAAARQLGGLAQERRFEFGLECLLEGIRVRFDFASSRSEGLSR
jgi:AcrR family transcriptional regulator